MSTSIEKLLQESQTHLIIDYNKGVLITSQGKEIPCKTIVRNGVTYVPCKLVVEQFGYKVVYDPATKTVYAEAGANKVPLEIITVNNTSYISKAGLANLGITIEDQK